MTQASTAMVQMLLADGDAPVVALAAVAVDHVHATVGRSGYGALLSAAAEPSAAPWCVCFTPGLVLLRGPGFDGIAGGAHALFAALGLGPPSYAPSRLLQQGTAWLAALRHVPAPDGPGPAAAARAALAAAMARVAAPRLVPV